MIKWEGMCFGFLQTIVHVGEDELDHILKHYLVCSYFYNAMTCS